MATETTQQREDRWARGRAEQDARAHSMAVIQAKAERIAAGQCVLEQAQDEPGKGWCLTHNVADSMAHHFEVHPDAYND